MIDDKQAVTYRILEIVGVLLFVICCASVFVVIR
jgi:hypothetical protein